jgi:four helix bundle protein
MLKTHWHLALGTHLAFAALEFDIKNRCIMQNDQKPMTNQARISNPKKYDLEERTARFGEKIIEFVKKIPQNPLNTPLISQVIRAGTSIGANYQEADGAESKRDFKHKISICKKESKETKHWLRMIAKANEEKIDGCRELWREAQELTLIFSSILRSCDNKK